MACAIVVTHQPDISALTALLNASRAQVGDLIVVDNASAQTSRRSIQTVCQQYNAKFYSSDVNLGVSGGLNFGIERAIALGYKRLLLLDQDSAPGPNMVYTLSKALDSLTAMGVNVAGVGPSLVDPRSGHATPFVRFQPGHIVRNACKNESEAFQPADFIITSGMLITAQTYARVGPFDESLFIDNVDLEWCFRARKMGYSFFGVCAAPMTHSIGDQVYLFFGRFPVYRHTPIRQYYILRNRLWLYRMPHAPWAWIVQDIPRAIVKCMLFALLIPPRLENIRMMLRGLRDGITKHRVKPE